MDLIIEVIDQARADQTKARAGCEAELASIKDDMQWEPPSTIGGP
jgi:hypothetical protein